MKKLLTVGLLLSFGFVGYSDARRLYASKARQAARKGTPKQQAAEEIASMSKERAARKIQVMWRAARIKEDVNKKKAAAELIQRIWRGKKGRARAKAIAAEIERTRARAAEPEDQKRLNDFLEAYM